MNFTELLEKVNAYIWLCIGATILIVLSLIYKDTYINQWILMLLYGMLGFGNSVAMKQYPLIQKVFSVVLLIAFLYLFTISGSRIGLFFGF